FFKQQRHGQKGQNFMIWKFRTMRQSADTSPQGVSAQQRVTGIGHWLRVSHLDELPQLWNVLLGHMSLVGPRPHMSSDHHMYQDAIASYGIRHWVKPGMTGLAQARGLKGEVDKSGMTERIRADIYYVENWSMLLDLKVLVATVFRLKTWV
ncbi:MAG: undecaprenyl-phosphate glucose phosphotransferase, partial [Flavobacteriales bacterium]|nr:undecaprenyl-phosphate glucose phosphotransferase [Flavobacteriales bacterium]